MPTTKSRRGRRSLPLIANYSCRTEVLEKRELLAITASIAPPQDTPAITADVVNQYGDALFGNQWQTSLGMTAQDVVTVIDNQTWRQLLDGDQNQFITNFRQQMQAEGSSAAQQWFDNTLSAANLRPLYIAQFDWFQDNSTTPVTPVTTQTGMSSAAAPLMASSLGIPTAAPMSTPGDSTEGGTISITDQNVVVTEGQDDFATFTIKLTLTGGPHGYCAPFSVPIETHDGSAQGWTDTPSTPLPGPDDDYATKTDTFAMADDMEGSTGEITQTFSVAILNDRAENTDTTNNQPGNQESPETFTVSLGAITRLVDTDNGGTPSNPAGDHPEQTATPGNTTSTATIIQPVSDNTDDNCPCNCSNGSGSGAGAGGAEGGGMSGGGAGAGGTSAGGMGTGGGVGGLSALGGGPSTTPAAPGEVKASGPQPAQLPSDGFNPTFKVSPLSGDLLLTQPLTSGVSLAYRSDDNMHPVIAINTPVLPAPPDDVLVSATATANFINGTPTFWSAIGTPVTVSYASSTGIAQGTPIRIAVPMDASNRSLFPNGDYNWEMTVNYTYDQPPGMPSHPVTISAKYFSQQANDFQHEIGQSIVNRTDSPYGNRWWISGLDQIIHSATTNNPILIRGNGDAITFYPPAPGSTDPAYTSPGFDETLTINTFIEFGEPRIGSYTLKDPDGNDEIFDGEGATAGDLDTVTDKAGNQTTYHYNASDNTLDYIADPIGNRTTFQYTSGKLSSVTDPFGNMALVGITGSLLTSVTSPTPSPGGTPLTVQYDYDSSVHQLSHLTDTKGHITTFSFNSTTKRLDYIQHPDASKYQIKPIETRGIVTGISNPFIVEGSDGPVTGQAQITNENNSVTLLTTDRFGQATIATGADNNTTSYDRNDDGDVHRVSAVDQSGDLENTTYGYDANGNLNSILYPDGTTSESWIYDSTFNEVTQHTDQLGNVTRYVLDPPTGKIAVQTQVARYGGPDLVTQFFYTEAGDSVNNPYDLPAGLLLKEIDPMGHVTTYNYFTSHDVTLGLAPQAAVGQVSSVTYASGTSDADTVKYTYDTNGNPLTQTDTGNHGELNRVTTYQYDALNRLVETIGPPPVTGTSGATTINNYGATGNLDSVQDPNGQLTSYVYNGSGLVTLETDPPDNTGHTPQTQSFYDSAGNLIKTIDPMNRVTQYFYDSLNRLIETIASDPGGSPTVNGPITRFTYDAAGDQDSMTDPLGHVTHYFYDSLHRLTETDLPDPDPNSSAPGPKIETTYDLDGNVLTTTDAKGLTTTYHYDEFGRVDKTTLSDSSGVISFTSTGYDLNGNVLTQTDANLNVTTYLYDNRDRQTDVYLPPPGSGAPLSGPHTHTTYNADSTVDTVTDPVGRVTTFGYDGAGRQTSATTVSADSTLSTTTYTSYDSDNNVLTSTDANGNVTTYQYDYLNRQTDVYQPPASGGGPLTGPHTVTAYDLDGEVTSVTDPASNTTTYQYDGMGRQKKVISPTPTGGSAPTITSTYDADGDLKTQTDALGETTSYSYDNLGRMTGTVEANGDTTTYTYDAAGNRTSVTDGAGNPPLFQAQTTLTAGTHPASVAMADLNHDGKSDLVIADSGDHNVSVRLGNGDGTFATSTSLYNTGVSPDFVTVADLGNGQPDLIVANYTDGTVSILLGVGDGTFMPSVPYSTGSGPTSVAVADLGNGHPDLIVANSGGSNVSVLLGNGDGTFNPQSTSSTGTQPRSVAVGDLNHDGKLDLVVANTTDHDVSVLLGNGDGSFLPQVTYATGNSPLQAVLADLRGNGNLDLVVTNSADNTVSVLLGNGNGTFQPQSTFATGASPWSVTATDLNADGNLDLAVGNFTDGTVSVLRGRGDGTFLPQLTFTTGGGAISVAAGDLNSDGRPDLVIANWADDTASELLAGAGNTTRFNFNTLGQLTSQTDQLGITQHYTYDLNGNLKTQIDGNGRLRTFDYDHLNREIDENWLASDHTTILYTDAMTYNPDGEMSSNVDGNSSYAYIYDGLGRLKSTDNYDPTTGIPHVVLSTGSSGYDANGNRLSLSATINGTLDFQNTYGYDTRNQETSVQQTGQTGGATVAFKKVTFAYRADGRLSQLHRLSSATVFNTTTYSYDADGRLTRQSGGVGGTFTWTYDAANHITQSVSPDVGTQNYGYDAAGQLKTNSHTGESYTYDGNGNRVANTVGPDNELLFDGTYHYVYDGQGNQILRYDTGGDARVMHYDYRNRLTELADYTVATVTSGVFVTGTLQQDIKYTYDVNNLRIAKSVQIGATGTPAVTDYVYDGQDVALEFDPTSTIPQRYLYGPAVDQILAEEQSTGRVLWTTTDNLGSVRYLFDNSRTIVDNIQYDSFGKVTNETVPGTNFLFGYTGAVYDVETGLQYHDARYYDPKAGNWISQDPIGFDGGQANLYVYAGNSPTNWIDPSGEKIYLGKGQKGKLDPVGVIHQDIAVDKWKKTVDGCGNEVWEKDGTASFSFGVEDTTKQQFQKQTDWLGWKDFLAVGFGLPAGKYMKGEVYQSTFDPKFVVDTLDTTRQQDMQWLQYMQGRLGTTDRYTVLFWNCVNYTNHEFGAAKGKFGK